MNSLFLHPDVKMNMSLDEIVQLTRKEIHNQLRGTHLRGTRKKKKSPKKKNDKVDFEHSVPLMGTTHGVDIYVSNHSPLLCPDNKARISQIFSMNSNLQQKPKEIMPGEYKSVRMNNVVEKVSISGAVDQLRPMQKKLPRPRQLNKNFRIPNQKSVTDLLPDKPPPLVAAPIYTPAAGLKMDVDNSDDEIFFLENPDPKKQVDVGFDFEDVLQAKKLCLSAMSMPHMSMKTLNDRFTMLCGNFIKI